MNPWIILGALVAAIALIGTGYGSGRSHERLAWEARIGEERAAAVEIARTQEHQLQEAANNALRKQNAALGRINAGLRDDLNGLRNRPERRDPVPGGARVACAGGTGAELSREDAGFLAGEAAHADELRAGLEACYAVIDAMNKKGPAP